MPAKVAIIPAALVLAVAIHLYRDEELREDVKHHWENLRRKTAEWVHKFADSLAPPVKVEEVPLAARSQPPPFPATEPQQEQEGQQRPRRKDVNEFRSEEVVTSAYEPAAVDALFDAAESGSSSSEHTLSVHTTLISPSVPSESGYETQQPQPQFESPQPETRSQPYWSIQEWASQTSQGSAPSSPSLAGSAAEELEVGSDGGDMESVAGASTVGSWTEVGSDFSDRGI